MKFSCTIFLLLVAAPLAYSEDWTTKGGTVYHDVKVLQVEPDSVVIMHREGGGRLPLAGLPGNLQQRFHYDPVLASAAGTARARETAASNLALQAEMNQAADMNAVPNSLETATPYLEKLVSKGVANSELDLRELAAFLGTSMEPDPNDPTHHSMLELSASMASVYRDLSEPGYHTMSNLVYNIHLQGLGPDPVDPHHHTIPEFSQQLTYSSPLASRSPSSQPR